ncbi:MAG: hypothetical protein H5U08_05175, partial [Thermogutta sp.]|nr:hypothetical protein [Thermogutta sp.]
TELNAAVFAAVIGAEDPQGLEDLARLAQQVPGARPMGAPPGTPVGYPGPGYSGPGAPPGYTSGPPEGYPGYPPSSPEEPSGAAPPGYGYPPGYPGAAPGQPGGMRGPAQPVPKLVSQERRLMVKGLPREIALKLAPKLWTPDAVALIEARLRQVNSLKESARDICLAATFPMSSIRLRLSGILKSKLEEGPEPLAALGLGNNLFIDPGMVVVVKSLPREEPPQPNLNRPVRPPLRRPGIRPGYRPGPGYGPGYPGGPGGSGLGEEYGSGAMPPGQPGATNVAALSAKVRWMLMAENVGRSVCRELKQAADRLATVDPGALESVSQKRPPEFQETHPNCAVVAEYHLDWPNSQLRQELPGVQFDPMRVHYIRLEGRSTLAAVSGFYRRKIQNITQRVISDGVWLDDVRTLTDGKARRQSIDVFVTHDAGDVTPSEEIDLVVELLSVEILAQDVAASVPAAETLR